MAFCIEESFDTLAAPQSRRDSSKFPSGAAAPVDRGRRAAAGDEPISTARLKNESEDV